MRPGQVFGPRFFSGALLPAILLFLPPASPGTASAQTRDPLPGDTLSTASTQDAYLDETARHLVRGLKAARDTAQLGIDAYTALIRERMAVEAPALRRDRPWVNGERVTRVRWSREEPDVAHLLGSRFRDPGQGPDDPYGYFAGLETERFATDPRADPFLFTLFALGAPDDDAAVIMSPLAADSERHYQFRSGDTTSVQPGDGRTVSAVAVTAIPRVRSIRLLAGIMWIEPESMAVVRVAYRLAKPVNREISWGLRQGGQWRVGMNVSAGPTDAGARPAADSAEAPDSAGAGDPPRGNSIFDRLVNGVVNNLIPPIELDITTVVADYTLWELRHWLPRRVLWEGHMSFGELPGPSDEPVPAVPTTIDWAFEIEDIQERGEDPAAGIAATAAEALERWRQPDDSVRGDVESEDPDETVTITPTDRAALALSRLLPPSLWEEPPPGLDDEAVAGIASALAGIGTGEGGDPELAVSPWGFHPPGQTLWLLRYNPVEWVSAGTRVTRDFDWGRAAATVRIPTRGLQAPDVQLTLLRDHPNRRLQFSLYRELRGGGIDDGGVGQSAGVFVAAGDSTDFYWSRGVSLRVLPGRGQRYRMSVRFFAESDADLAGGGDIVPEGGDGAVDDPASPGGPASADVRNRFGVAASWHPWWGGETSRAMGGGGWAGIRGTVGDNPHLRAGVTGAIVVPLGGGYSAAMEAGGARVWGDPARLDLWSLGADGLWLRGHSDNLQSSGIWRARLDLQRPVSYLRLSVFTDWARAGGHDYHAVGAGLVFMDGITRLDLAHGLRFGEQGPLRAVPRVHLQGDVLY